MKILQTTLFLACMATLSSTAAWAQFGLYGSPEMLNLPPPPSAVGAHLGRAAPLALPIAPPAPLYASQGVERVQPLVRAVAADEVAPAPPGPPTPVPQSPGEQPAPAGTSVVDQMLAEAEPPDSDYEMSADSGVPYGHCGPLTKAVGNFERKVMAVCGDGYCDPAACCPWYGSISALTMSRDKGNRVWTSYRNGSNSVQLTHTQDIEMSWRTGGEIRFGRRFCCDGGYGPSIWSLEATYWALEPFDGYHSTLDAAGLATPLSFLDVDFGGTNADQWFGNAAREHILSRHNEFQNVELNVIKNSLFSNYRFDIDCSAGVRFFRFEESLLFGSLRNSGSWGVGADEAYLSDQVINNLIGMQFGCDVNYRLLSALEFFASPKIGIYNNHIRNVFRVYRGDGTIATQSAYPGETYPVVSNKNAVSFVTQVDLGLRWKVTRRWSAKIGYRALIATGIGLADNQIPPYIVDTPEIRDIDLNGQLVLHGGFAGVEYNF